MRIAIAHDYLIQFGGAERVLLALMDAFPNAPVYTLLYDREGMPIRIDESRIRTSWLQKLPGARRHHRYFPLLMPLAVEQLDFSGYDVVISDTHSFTKGIITGPETLHISYCFTPTRYVWDDCHRYVREFSRLAFFKRLAPVGISYLRMWDYYASQRVNHYLTLSQVVAQRIQKYYRRPAEVLPPPVDVDRYTPGKDNDGYYLVVSRLVPYKRVDLAIDACERIGRTLLVVGTGPEYELLKQRAGKNTVFLGFVDDQDLPELYGKAKALLFPQEEDFGITPLEAAAAGKPTIAYGAGGALETIEDGVTGMFFQEQTTEALCRAIQDYEQRSWDPLIIRRHAEKYRREHFLQAIRQKVHNQWMDFKAHNEVRV